MLGNNYDLSFTILSLLPTRSVIRFRSVSKLWQSIISDPYFIKVHTNNCNNPYTMSNLICSCPDADTHCSYSLSSMPLPDLSLSILKCDAESMRPGCSLDVFVLRSFYGLLICPVIWNRSKYRFSFEFIYIFNPVTLQYKKIQIEPRLHPCDIILTPDHKLIMFARYADYYYQIRMYSKKTQSWKIIYSFKGGELTYDHQLIKGVFLKGSVYWANIDRKSLIFSLNVESFQVQKLAFPDHAAGRLYLIMEQKQYDFIFHVMEIKEDLSGWDFLKCIDLKFMRDILPPALSQRQIIVDEDSDWVRETLERLMERPYVSALSPIHLVEGEGEDHELLLTMTVPSFQSYEFVHRAVPKMWSYNLVTKTYREIINVADAEGFYTTHDMDIYYPMFTTLDLF
ncbi:Ferritin-like protein [Dioscorea alata]|uniref:Ferritin-like protein n=1 Tax=Dioscorea alata TaxID=55571 RepID=A0ACB7V8D6_DIOAL|nr:Ferritin-like protein [Dioscorea alata]